jgi:hypothetical protein
VALLYLLHRVTMIRNWLTGSLLVLVCATFLSVGKMAGDGLVLAVASKSGQLVLNETNVAVAKTASKSHQPASIETMGALTSEQVASSQTKLGPKSDQLSSNETRREPAILELSWERKDA